MKQTVFKSYDELPLFLSAKTVAWVLGISAAGTYDLLRRKDFPVAKMGSRLLASKEQFLTGIGFSLSSGQAHDVPEGIALLKEILWKKEQKYLLMDHAYEGENIRSRFVARVRASRTAKNCRNPWKCDKERYKQHKEIERFFRRIFTRYDELDAGELLGLLNSDIDLKHKFREVRQGIKEVCKRDGVEHTAASETSTNGTAGFLGLLG